MKQQADKERKDAEVWKMRDKVILSTKDLMFKKRPVKKLVDWYVGPYTIDEVVSTNVVKLQLPTLMRIQAVVNVSWVVWYKEQVGQKAEEVKLVEVEGVKEWEVEKILNKRKVRRVVKYLVQWKRFIAKHDSWERKEDLENAKEVVVEFEGRLNAEVRKQEKLDIAEERDFKRGELPEKYIEKMLYKWNNRKFENEYLRKLERSWEKWKEKDKMIWREKASSFRVENLKEGVMLESWTIDFIVVFIFYFNFILILFCFYFYIGLGVSVTSWSQLLQTCHTAR